MFGNQCNRFQDNTTYIILIYCASTDTKEEVDLQTEYNQTYPTLVIRFQLYNLWAVVTRETLQRIVGV